MKIKTNTLSSEAQKLIEHYQLISERSEAGLSEPKIKVGETLSLFAVVYEKMRNAVDYRGEHLLRRNATERILRRQLWESPAKAADTQKLSDSLIKELIWARYVKNDSVTKSKSKEIAKVLAKYIRLLNLLSEKIKTKKEIRQWNDWFLGVASSEVEEVLDPLLLKNDALTFAMYSWFKNRFEWEDSELSDSEKNIQLIIAVQRSLFKSDQAKIRYYLLKYLHRDWLEISEDKIKDASSETFNIAQKIEKTLNSSFQPRLYRLVQKQTAPFEIIAEIIDQDLPSSRQKMSNYNQLETAVEKICDHKYEEIGERVNRGIRRSIVYIFVTKVLLALVIEVPYELFLLGGIRFIPIGINLIVPPFLMFLMGLTIKKPGQENTEVILKNVSDFVYDKPSKEKTSFSLSYKTKLTFKSRIFWSLYSTLFLLIIGAISFGLYKLHFNIVSGFIFFMFLSLVLLFGFRVKFSASELNITQEKEGLSSHLLTNVSLPLLNLGVWFSSQLSKFNFLVVVFDFLIEAPLKSILGIFEEWASFIRERREEVIEVPANQ